MKKFMVLVSLVLVVLLLGACVLIVQPPTEAPMQVPLMPTEELGLKAPEYTTFIYKYQYYFDYLVEINSEYAGQDIANMWFYNDENGYLTLGINVTGAYTEEDDGLAMVMTITIVNKLIEDGQANFPVKPLIIMIRFMDGNANVMRGAAIYWAGLEMFTNNVITLDQLLNLDVVYPIYPNEPGINGPLL